MTASKEPGSTAVCGASKNPFNQQTFMFKLQKKHVGSTRCYGKTLYSIVVFLDSFWFHWIPSCDVGPLQLHLFEYGHQDSPSAMTEHYVCSVHSTNQQCEGLLKRKSFAERSRRSAVTKSYLWQQQASRFVGRGSQFMDLHHQETCDLSCSSVSTTVSPIPHSIWDSNVLLLCALVLKD